MGAAVATPCCSTSHHHDDEKPPDSRIAGFLKNVDLFKRLPAELHPALASCCTRVEFRPGEQIIKQGAEGLEFYVIMQGQASVDVDGKVVATLGCGDYFGEMALLRDEPRTATILAITSISTLRITREQFQRLGLQEKLDFQKRGAVGGGASKEVITKPPSPKTDAEQQLMIDAFKTNASLGAVVKLTDTQIAKLISSAWKEAVSAGTSLIKQDDLEVDYFYIVQEGSFDVFVDGREVQSAEQAATSGGAIGKGGSFGVLALLYVAPRAATVRAKVNSVVWVIDRNNFKQVLAKTSEDIVLMHAEHLRKVGVLSALKDCERLEVAKALIEATFLEGEIVMQQGEKGETFHILIVGEVSVSKDGKEEARLKASQEKPQFFGEVALLNSEPRTATIKIVSPMATTLTLDRASFDMMLGPLAEIKDRGSEGVSKVGHFARHDSASRMSRFQREFGMIAKKDLRVLGLLGCGGFGAVELVEHVTTGSVYALKSLSKGYVMKSGMQASVMSEKKVQIQCDSTFIVKLFETFNGEQTLYFLLEVALGGELYATYHRKSLFGREPHAKFYVAGVVFAFDHMHQRHVLFRDLKPENILLDDQGQLKITDMGLAKIIVGKTFTTCGTPDYFAPELIRSIGHTRALDWWTLGILCFELLAGRTPFEAPTPMMIYSKVVRGIHRVEFPAKMKGPPEDLIKGLCKMEPSERLPMRKGGIENIQKHEFYGDYDWDSMGRQKLEAPYLPAVKSNKDFANFSARKEDMPPQFAYKDNGSGWDADFATSE